MDNVSIVRQPLPQPSVVRVQPSPRDDENKGNANPQRQSTSFEQPPLPTGATDTLGNKLNVYA